MKAIPFVSTILLPLILFAVDAKYNQKAPAQAVKAPTAAQNTAKKPTQNVVTAPATQPNPGKVPTAQSAAAAAQQAKANLADNSSACKKIEGECLKAGYKYGGAGQGLGLVNQCFFPIIGMGKQGKLPLPKIYQNMINDCKKEKNLK